MTPFRADLHCHTTSSDGSETPERVIQLAKEAGLAALSITDHDTIDAYATAIPLAKEAGITILPGVEFSTVLDQKSVHILGYGFHINDKAISDLCSRHVARRKERNLAVLELLKKQGISIAYEDLIDAIPSDSKSRSIGRPHIALAMMKKGYIGSIQEGFEKFLSDDGPCFVQGNSITVDETIDTIHRAKGVAVIAHPHLIKNTELLNKLLTKDFDGMECYYGNFQASSNTRWLKIAKHRNWLITGGSDFHGTAKPTLNIGSSWIGQEHFQAILNRLAANNP